jgi:exoribonuclease R
VSPRRFFAPALSSPRESGLPPVLDFAALRTEFALPDGFSAASIAQAEQAARRPATAATAVGDPRVDRTDLDFITIDPLASKDLDQAVHIGRDGEDYLVSYAIADVAAFVDPESALDHETRTRGETYYLPDARVPLHPPVLSEGAASLLPGQTRPVALWQIRLDAQAEPLSSSVVRATIRSREQWDYVSLQQALDAGTAPQTAVLVAEVGSLRQSLARERHAISLDLPEQEVVRAAGGGWDLVLRAATAIENANAEISLLTGMCAAALMIEAGVGILRTLPPPEHGAIRALQAIAPALDVPWPDGTEPGDVLAALDPADPRHAAFIGHAASLLRGAAYTVFDGVPPQQPRHSGIAAAYAHVTAPLRRLVDRFGTEICLAAANRRPVPDWVRAALPDLPGQMAVADHLSHQLDRAVVDATEAFLLSGRVGERFEAVVLSANGAGGTVAIAAPAVRANCAGQGLPVGERITVILEAADVAARTVQFVRAG